MASPTIAAVPRPRRPLQGASFAAGIVAWMVAVTAGFATLFRHSETPGAAGAPPARWPSASPVRLDAALPTLVLLAHPLCPCTAATIAELDRLMARCAGKVAATVLFYADPRLSPHWEQTDLWRHARRIPGVHAQADPMGEAARTFGAPTSGTVVLYAPSGRLLFHGGITASRGHEGSNAGATAILAIVTGDGAPPRTTAVYGCELRTPQSEGSR